MYGHQCSEYGCDHPEYHGIHPQFGGLFSSIANAVGDVVSAPVHVAESVASTVVSAAGSTANLVSNAAKVAGHEIGKATSTLASAVGTVTNLVGKIPIVGAPVHAVLDSVYHAAMAPANLVVDVAIHGKRIDKAVMGQLDTALQDVKGTAPYAQMVVSMVPGIGSGVSAAIGGGISLMNGQPIDEALKNAVLSAVPGGPLGQSLANIGYTAIQSAATGQPVSLDTIAHSAAGGLINSLPLPDSQKQLLRMTVATASQIAHGQTPAIAADALDAAFSSVMSQLPPDAKKAIQTGLALGTAVVKQGEKAIALSGPAMNKLIDSGIGLAKTLPAVQAARNLVGSGTRGFDLAQGLLSQKAAPFDVAHYRSMLTGADLKGFDTAMAAKIGMVAHPPTPNLSPAAAAGRAITLGMQGAPAANKQAIMASITASPSATVGAKVAVTQVAANREPWYVRLVHALGFTLGHNHPAASHTT